MKTLFLFLIFFTSLAFGKAPLSLEEFEAFEKEEQEDVIVAYQEFFRSIPSSTESEKFSSYQFHFLQEAYAAGNFDCFYAGWPSVSVAKPNGGKACRSPKTGNPDYPQLSSLCGEGTMLCQPLIFGEGLCVTINTPVLRNTAYAQCETRFRQSGKTPADVVETLNTPEKRASLQELFESSESVCRTGFQRGSTLCDLLKKKITAIKRISQNRQTQTLSRVAETAVTITTTPFHTEVICPPEESATRSQTPDVMSARRRSCPRPPLAGPAPDIATLNPILSQNNIRIVAGTLTDTRQLQRFLDDFNRFPEPLREEMKRNGSRINLIIGTGVTEDPSWQAEASRGARPQDWITTHDGRSWSTVPGSGGSLGRNGTPTRVVINRLYDGHGSASLFLHEYGHTLDNMYGEHAIASSRIWRDTIARDTRATEFLTALCPSNYCADPAHPGESFAELFAYYHACSATKEHMRAFMPNISNLFDRLTNVRDLLDGRIDVRLPASQPTP